MGKMYIGVEISDFYSTHRGKNFNLLPNKNNFVKSIYTKNYL